MRSVAGSQAVRKDRAVQLDACGNMGPERPRHEIAYGVRSDSGHDRVHLDESGREQDAVAFSMGGEQFGDGRIPVLILARGERPLLLVVREQHPEDRRAGEDQGGQRVEERPASRNRQQRADQDPRGGSAEQQVALVDQGDKTSIAAPKQPIRDSANKRMP